MGRWTPDDDGCIYDETGCFARLTPNKAERLASRHNDNIDALTAELAAANTTLDRLREIHNGCVEPKCSSQEDYADLVQRLESILYPPEIPNA